MPSIGSVIREIAIEMLRVLRNKDNFAWMVKLMAEWKFLFYQTDDASSYDSEYDDSPEDSPLTDNIKAAAGQKAGEVQDTRLVGGSSPLEGRVEIQYNNVWVITNSGSQCIFQHTNNFGPDIINSVFYSRWKGIIRTV